MDFWSEFYAKNKGIDAPTSFSKHVYDTYLKKYNDDGFLLKIGDFGSGNCADSRYLSEKGNMVYAVDKYGVNNTEMDNCTLIKEDAEDFLKLNPLRTLLDVVYMRWFLHAIPYDKAERVFSYSINSLKPGGLICIEVRSLDDMNLLEGSTYDESDKSYSTTHKRWPYNKEMLDTLIENKDLELLEFSEGYFSYITATETENPLLIRLILKKKVLQYYERSENYSIYASIPSTMKKRTFKSYDTMNKLNPILEKYMIKYAAVAGTALGLNRHGGIIPWDNDIDIGFIQEEWDKLIKIRKELKECGLQIIEVTDNRWIAGFSVDLFLLKKEGDYYSGFAKTYCHIDEYQPVYKQIFGYTYIYAPISCTKSLTHRYGDKYFTEADVNDGCHFSNADIGKYTLVPYDLSYQVK
jgi:hypothetical protein